MKTKTITLKEAYSKATKGPLRLHQTDGKTYPSIRGDGSRCVADCGSRSDQVAQANAALLAHAFNVLPEVVTTLEELRHWLTNPDLSKSVIEAYCHDIDLVLAKANQVAIPATNS